MIITDDKTKFEAIKYRHEDQSKLLQLMSEVDLKVFISFLTLQLALGGFLSQFSIEFVGKLGILFIDISLTLICTKLLWNNFKRRKEVVETIKNCNLALGYDTEKFYVKNKKINSDTKFRPWFWPYFLAIIISLIGIILIMSTEPVSYEIILNRKSDIENMNH